METSLMALPGHQTNSTMTVATEPIGNNTWASLVKTRYICPNRLKTRPLFFQKSGVRGFTLKWDHKLSLEIPPTILVKLQDGASATFAIICYPSKNSYELLPDVSALVHRGHLSPCTNVETCGSMVSPLVIQAE